MSLRSLSLNLRLLGSLEAQHVTRQVVELLIVQRKFRHERPRRYRLRIAKMFQMPFSFRPRVADVGQVGPHGTAFTVNAMTADAAELIVERVPPARAGSTSLRFIASFLVNRFFDQTAAFY